MTGVAAASRWATWFREAALRLLLAPAYALLIAVLLLVVLAVVLFGPGNRRLQILRGLSRTLCGAADGEGDVTYSAMSAENRRRRERALSEAETDWLVTPRWDAGYPAAEARMWRARDALDRAELRVRLVDALPGNGPGHCERAWDWHQDHRLFDPDEAPG